MKIALIGATGFAGQKILDEALSRNHQVTAIARAIDKLPPRTNMRAVSVDINNVVALEKSLSGHDVVVTSVHFLDQDYQKLSAVIKAAGVKRWIVVGGAGSLQNQNGVQILDSPEFPDAFKAEANAGRTFLNQLKNEKNIDWTFISPSAEFIPGERTDKFRIESDRLLVSESGRSYITNSDYAVALVDELERPQYFQKRFTVGY